MKVKNVTSYTDLIGSFKPNDVVWMCEVNPSALQKTMSLRPPRRGRLMPHNTKTVNEYFMTQTNPEDWIVSHFIPFKRNSDTELAYGLAEPIFKSGHKSFASTETECNELYKELVLEAMKPHQEILEKLQKTLDDMVVKHSEYDGAYTNVLKSDCKNMEISPLTVIKCKERWQLERLSEMGLRFSGTKRLEENMNVYPCWVFIEREGHVNFSTDPAYVMKAVKEECFTICEFSDLVTKSIKQNENQEIKTDNGWYHINDVKPDDGETVSVILERRARPGVSYAYDIQESVYRCGYPKGYFIEENDAWHVRYWRRETLIPYPNGVVSTEIAECKKNKISPSKIIEHQKKCGIEIPR